MCYICGRQTLLAGFDHHVKQCADLFEKREALKPPRERRPVPQDPLIAYGATKGSNGAMGGEYSYRELEDINLISQAAYQQNLAQCEFCGRRFLPEKLVIHNRSCTASNPAKGVPSATGTPSRPSGTPSIRPYPPTLKTDQSGQPPSASPSALKGGASIESTRLPSIPSASMATPPQRGGSRNGLRNDSGSTPYSMQQNSPMALPPSEPRESKGSHKIPPRGLKGSSTRSFTSGFGAPPAESEYVVPAMLITCPDCGRHFNEVSYEKHYRVCKQVFESKRKPFDSSKARMRGTEMESFNRRGRKAKSNAISGSSTNDLRRGNTTSSLPSYSSTSSPSGARAGVKPNWKKQSEAFRAAIRAARLVSIAEKKSKATGIPLFKLLPQQPAAPANDAVYADYVTCPTCGRRFNQTAGARHIPKCKDIINKPSFLSRGSGHSATSAYR